MNVNRRTALARMLTTALGGIALTGCDWIGGASEPPHPLLGLLEETRDLLARHHATLKAHPTLAQLLTPLRDNHRTHIAKLVTVIGPSASPSPSTAADPPTPPAQQDAAITVLRDAERDAAAAAVNACLDAPTKNAGLLGSIAACRATHQEVLK